MKKVYQKCLWISYITVGIAVFFFSLAVIVVPIFFWFINKDLSFLFMSFLSCIVLMISCLKIRKFMQSHWQEMKKEFKEEIEIQSNDWMEHTWFSLKSNIKRKEFWTLQLWPFGKICSYVARLVFDLAIYLFGIFGTTYYLIRYPNWISPSDIFTVLMTSIVIVFAFILSHLLLQIIKQKLTMSKLFKSLFDFIVLGSILTALIECIDHSGRTIEGLKDFLTTFIQFINEYMYLFVFGCVLALIGYVSTKFIKRSIEKEIDIDLIPTLFGYEYYVDYGKYDGLLHTNTVHTSIQEFTNKEIKDSIQGEQKRKFIDRSKEVYNFYEVEAFLRYGIGEVWLDGSHILQNKPYIGWKSDALEVSKKLSMKEDEIQ